MNKRLKDRGDEIYDILIETLEGRKWHYDAHKEDNVVLFTLSNSEKNYSLRYVIRVIDELELIEVYLPMSFLVPEEKRTDFAIALCQTNYRLVDGHYVLDMTDGQICFKMGCSYHDNLIGEELFGYLIDFSYCVVDAHNDMLCGLNDEKITLKEYIGLLYRNEQ